MSDKWLFLDGVGGQRGPIPTKVLQRLICRTDRIPSMAWREGMEKWEPLTSLEDFSQLIQTSYKPWSYLDGYNATVGPMKASEIVRAFSDGHIDGMTKVWTPGFEEWKGMGDISELKEFLAHAVNDEKSGSAEAEEEIGQRHEEVYDPSVMTYVQPDTADDEHAIPRIDDDVRRGLNSKRVKERGEKEVDEVRSFTGDHGINYKWCEKEQDWMVGGKGDGEGEEESTKDTENNSSNIISRKRNLHKSVVTESVVNGNEGNRESTRGVQTEKTPPPKKKSKKSNRPWVYVEGIPPDASEEELAAHFSKVGILDLDPMTLKPRVKIYQDENGQPKGDASICYAKNTSVGLALQVLDGSQLRVNVVLKVTRAVFTPAKGGAKDRSKKQLQVGEARLKTARRAAKQALSWNDEDDTGMLKGLKIVILENVFDPSEIKKDKGLVHELHTDISEECDKLGPVEKITVFSRNPLGPVAVKFGTAYAAEECIKVMDGRWFGKRQLRCHYWDGATNYVVEESNEEQKKRLDEFGDWLESQDLSEEMRMKVRD